MSQSSVPIKFQLFNIVDSLEEQKAVVSLRLSPEPLINKTDYDQIKAFEKSHPELYNKPDVLQIPYNSSYIEEMAMQCYAFNYMFYKRYLNQ